MESEKYITTLEKEITAYEDIMFGLMLYQKTSPKQIQLLQLISYKNMTRRGIKAIEKAKKILREAKEGKAVIAKIASFEWPIILEDMRYRIEILLKCYEKLFSGRSREKELTKDEIIALRNEAIHEAYK